MDANNNFNNQAYDPNAANAGYQNYGYQPAPAPVSDMTVGNWILTLFLAAIPTVGFILLIVWAVSGSTDKPSRKNWAIATLIWQIIAIIIVLLLYFFVFAAAGIALNS